MGDNIRIRQEGTSVQLLKDGKLLVEMPWDAALEVARVIQHVAHRAEELAKHTEVALDHAILLRAGVPIGLAVDPRVVEEAEQMAQYDRDLRRYMPGGVKSKERFGVPTVTQHPPRGGSNG
jgi:hypothetical protein